MPSRPDLPDPEASRQLADWLSGPRGRLLRRARIGLCDRVLEIGPGHGFVTEELARRARGAVVTVDLSERTRGAGIPACGRPVENAVLGSGLALPLADESFDLVFCQNVLLWTGIDAISEAARVLQPGGAVCCIEPDFGGMMEWPPEIALRDVWLRGLAAAGADPEIGRKLPGACESAGLDVWAELQNVPRPATTDAVRLSKDLPLADEDTARVDAAEAALLAMPGIWGAFIHVPYVLVVATK